MQGISSIKLRAVSAKITLLSKDDESRVRADLYLQHYWRVTALLLTVWSGQSDVMLFGPTLECWNMSDEIMKLKKSLFIED